MPRRFALLAVEADGILSDALDQAEHCTAFLAANGVAENAAEQPDILAQWQVLVGNFDLVQLGENSFWFAPAIQSLLMN